MFSLPRKLPEKCRSRASSPRLRLFSGERSAVVCEFCIVLAFGAGAVLLAVRLFK